jgi:outer membrane protein
VTARRETRPVRLSPALLATLLAAAALPAAAQDGGARTLTLAEASSVAAEHNPAYRKAQADLQVAAADRRRAWGAFLPDVSASYSTGGRASRTFTGRDPFGNPVRNDDPIERTSSSTSQGISLTQFQLWDWGARWKDLRAARAGGRATEARVAGESARVGAELGRRYWAAVEAQEAISLEERLLAGARERLDATRRLLRIAAAGPVDVLAAELDVARQEQALEKARGDRRKAVLSLREQMGVMEDGDLRLTDAPPAPFDPSSLDAAALVARATNAAPGIAESDARVEEASHRLSATGARRWPALSMNVNADRSEGAEALHGTFNPNPVDQALSVSLSVSIPLFDQFRTTQERATGRARLAAAREDARAARLTAERDVRGAVLDVENAYRASVNADRALQLARTRLELSQEQYRVGSLDFTKLQTAVDDAAKAERDALAARFDFAAAVVTLEEKSAGPLPR